VYVGQSDSVERVTANGQDGYFVITNPYRLEWPGQDHAVRAEYDRL